MRRPTAIALFFICLVIGIATGLAYAWLVAPARPGNSSPAKLNLADRELYLRLVAATYNADGDVAAAGRRLAALGSTGTSELIDLIALDLAGGRATTGAAQLVELAVALHIDAPVVALLAPPRQLPVATAPATKAPAAAAATEVASGVNVFTLLETELVCTPGEDARRIEIDVTDEDGEPLPGIAITVAWAGDGDSFYTGFVAGQSDGYADFEMSPDTVYSIAVAGDEPLAVDIQSQFCPDGHAGGWRLAYQTSEP